MVFVTGGTGLVGSHLILELLKTDKKVKALIRNWEKEGSIRELANWYGIDYNTLTGSLEWVEGDINDYFFLDEVISDIDEVYHCAAEISFNPSDKYRMISSNVKSTSNIVNVCIDKGINKLCHVSSVAALGRESEGNIIDEDTSCRE